MILIDSSVRDVAKNERDENHELAEDILRDVLGRRTHGKPLVTDYIVDEVPTWLNKKVNHHVAKDASRLLFDSPEIEVEKVNWAVIRRARDLFEEKSFLSFTDVTTAVVMNTRDIRKFATFDSDFKKLEFEVIGV